MLSRWSWSQAAQLAQLCEGACRFLLRSLDALVEAQTTTNEQGNRESSTAVFISTRTIETHRGSTMRRLQLDTRAQLVNDALANGLIGSG